MKNSKYILFSAMLVTLLLAACAPVSPNVENTHSSAEDLKQDQNVVPKNVDLAVSGRYGNDMNCDLLLSRAKKEECKAFINDMIGGLLEREIIDTFDVPRCKVLSGVMAEECQKRLEETGVKGPISEEDAAALSIAMTPVMPEMTDGSDSAQSKAPYYDENLCKSLKTEGLAAYCVKQVTELVEQQKFSEIIISGKAADCQTLTSEDKRNDCNMILNNDRPK